MADVARFALDRFAAGRPLVGEHPYDPLWPCPYAGSPRPRRSERQDGFNQCISATLSAAPKWLAEGVLARYISSQAYDLA